MKEVINGSRPTRARGLKLAASSSLAASVLVAPHAGAWIETLVFSEHLTRSSVAPHAGAWIET